MCQRLACPDCSNWIGKIEAKRKVPRQGILKACKIQHKDQLKALMARCARRLAQPQGRSQEGLQSCEAKIKAIRDDCRLAAADVWTEGMDVNFQQRRQSQFEIDNACQSVILPEEMSDEIFGGSSTKEKGRFGKRKNKKGKK